MNEYDVGDGVRMEVTFKDVEGAPVDPTVVACLVHAPDGTEVAPAIVNEADVGEFSAQVLASMPGTYRYRFTGSGSVDVVEEGRFYVRRQWS